jgi:acetaldehyde dehydrogenase/alcohol dehydrogenase
MSKPLIANNGFSALVHAIESIVSVAATDYTIALAIGAFKTLTKYLPISYSSGADDMHAREKVQNAAVMAGLAFANAYVGVCHSLAHKLCATFNLLHGIANSLMICEVIRYNANESPSKFTAFPQYRTPQAVSRYVDIAESIGIIEGTNEAKVEGLITRIQDLRKAMGLPMSIQEAGVSEEEFLAKVDELAMLAFDDQCAGTNPRYPLVAELRKLYMNAYYKK